MFSPDGTLISASAAPHCGGISQNITARGARSDVADRTGRVMTHSESVSGAGQQDNSVSGSSRGTLPSFPPREAPVVCLCTTH